MNVKKMAKGITYCFVGNYRSGCNLSVFEHNDG